MISITMWNYVAIIVAAIVSMVIGMLWFGKLFGMQWMKEAGLKRPAKGKMPNMTMSYVKAFIGALVAAGFFDWLLSNITATGWTATWAIAFAVWVGTVAVAIMGNVLWEGKSTKYYAITAFYYLVNYLFVISVIHYLGA